MDYNTLSSNAFTFTINRLPQTVFRVVSINLPGINVSPVESGQPEGDQYFPGSSNNFEELQMTFIVDENLLNYEELYNWITQQRYITEYKAKNTEEALLTSDGVFVTMTNSSVPNRVFTFRDMFPISLSSLNFDTRESNPDPVTCQVSFKYSYFTFQKKSLLY